MILYSKAWQGFPLIFRVQGTAWPSGILPGIVAVAIGYVISIWPEVNAIMSDKNQFIQHPYPFQLYAFIIGFIIVFRTNFAYQRYWEGRGTIAQMGSKWLDGCCMSVSFDATGDETTPYLDGIDTHDRARRRTSVDAVSHERFFEEIVHLFSLMHALALQHLRSDSNLDHLKELSIEEANGQRPQNVGSDGLSSPLSRESRGRLTALNKEPLHSYQISAIQAAHRRKMLRMNTSKRKLDGLEEFYRHQCLDVVGGLSDEERAALETDALDQPIPTEARVTMVESWIMRRLIARQKHEKSDMGATSPPILSRLYQVVSDGFIGFGQASKISDTPFPFPYQNIIQIMLWIYVFTLPVLMNAFLREPIIRGLLTFMAVWCYFALNQVGSNLEDPYLPHDPNELPLPHIQYSFNAKLLSLGVIPERPDLGAPVSPPVSVVTHETVSPVGVDAMMASQDKAGDGLIDEVSFGLKDEPVAEALPRSPPAHSSCVAAGGASPSTRAAVAAAPAEKLGARPSEKKAQNAQALARAMSSSSAEGLAAPKKTMDPPPVSAHMAAPVVEMRETDAGLPSRRPVAPEDAGGKDAGLERKERILRQTLEEMRSGHARLADLVEALVLQRDDLPDRGGDKLRLPLLSDKREFSTIFCDCDGGRASEGVFGLVPAKTMQV